MLGIHPEAQGMALMQSSPLEAAHCTLALTFKGVHTTCAWPVSEAQWRNNRKDVEELLTEAIDARGT